MYRRYCEKTSCKNSPLDCHQSSHHHLVVQHLCVLLNMILTIDAPSIGLIRNGCSDIILGCQSRLWIMGLIRRGMAGRHLWLSGSIWSETRGSDFILPLEWADGEYDASSKPSALSEPEANLAGVTVSVRYSSNCETVTTPNTTFLAVPRVVPSSRVEVHGA